jgi:hypothetical protein
MKIANMFSINTLLFSLLVLVSSFVDCKNDKIKVDATLMDAGTISPKEVELKVQILNLSGNIIEVPDVLFWGLKNDPYADFILEIERKDSGLDFKSFAIPDNYQPQYRKTVLTKLNDKDTLNDNFNIAGFYSYRFPKGAYRVRVLFKVSKHNKINDIYSNWVEFAIK